jgi:hypothetical protein
MQRRADPGRNRRASIEHQMTSDQSDARHVQTGIMLLPACHYHLWEMRINFGSLWHRGHLHAGEHGRDFRPVWVEGKNSPDKWAYVLLISDVRTPLRFNSHSQARCLLELCINSISQFHSLPNYDSTSHSILSSSILLCPIIIPCYSRLHGNRVSAPNMGTLRKNLNISLVCAIT